MAIRPVALIRASLLLTVALTACAPASTPAPTSAPAAKPTQAAKPAESRPAAAVRPTGAPVQSPTSPAAREKPPTFSATPAPDARSVEPAAPGGGPTPPACCSTGGNAVPNNKPYDSTFFQHYGVNPFIDTDDDPLSTFAMDVDTASYTVMRRFLRDGHLPDKDSVRPEEYVNFFDYRYPRPENGQDFAISLEAGPSPFGGTSYELVQIGIQARHLSKESRKPAALTFVIDVSGSMNIESRLGTVKRALTLLVRELRDDDTVAIAVYGTDARVAMSPTRGSDKSRILAAIDALAPSGSTNVEAGLKVGFDLAEQVFDDGRTNMILLLSDGVANNGVTDAEALLARYRRYLNRGIQLSTYGFGMGNFNDVLMEKLANGGNGRYAYIDSVEEARRVFVENLTGTLETVARDAKVQVEFDPRVVSRYRLVGYENRDVADKDFRNDRVDAGEVGAGHSVTALYEIKRAPGAIGDALTVRIRYQRPDGGRVVEEHETLITADFRSSLSETTPRFKLAATVAQFAELLRHSYWAKDERIGDVLGLADEAARGFGGDPSVAEFTTLLNKAASLAAAPR